MDDWRTDPGREADRLRIILTSFLAVSPDMPISTAVPMIFETEKQTAELESRAVEEKNSTVFHLPDLFPATIAKFIDLCPEIQHLIHGTSTAVVGGGGKIHAIKETRARTAAGLKEAKEGVEEWERQNRGAPARSAPPSWASTSTTVMNDIAVWMDLPAQSDILGFLPHKRINAIKEVRLRYPRMVGLKEAKDAVEYWLDGKHKP